MSRIFWYFLEEIHRRTHRKLIYPSLLLRHFQKLIKTMNPIWCFHRIFLSALSPHRAYHRKCKIFHSTTKLCSSFNWIVSTKSIKIRYLQFQIEFTAKAFSKIYANTLHIRLFSHCKRKAREIVKDSMWDLWL